MVAVVIPAPTAELSIIGLGQVVSGPVAIDLVCTPEAGGIARVMVPVPGNWQSFRLDFTRDQLAALLDELVDLADALEVQRDTLTAQLSYGGC